MIRFWIYPNRITFEFQLVHVWSCNAQWLTARVHFRLKFNSLLIATRATVKWFDPEQNPIWKRSHCHIGSHLHFHCRFNKRSRDRNTVQVMHRQRSVENMSDYVIKILTLFTVVGMYENFLSRKFQTIFMQIQMTSVSSLFFWEILQEFMQTLPHFNEKRFPMLVHCIPMFLETKYVLFYNALSFQYLIRDP